MSTVLVVGGSRGYGRGITEAFARRGDDVAVVAREQAALDETEERIGALGGQALVV